MKYSSRVLLKNSTLLLIVILFLPQMAEAKAALAAEAIDIPLDGGLSLLIAAGVGYGVKRFRDNEGKRPVENSTAG